MAKTFAIFVLMTWLIVVLLARLADLHGNAIDLQHILSAPSLQHWFGTDDLGRDIFARICRGVEVSFTVAVVVTLVTMVIGLLVGVLAGFYGGMVDRLLMQVTDIFLAFPGILLAIAFAAVLGPGMLNLLLALCLTGWVSYARLSRGQVLGLRQRPHVLAAASLGAGPWRLIIKHILPMLGALIMVEATYGLASIMIAEASLSFLGLGIQAPNASWGAMLRDGVRYMLVAPHYVLIVGLSLMSLILAINLGGDYLRDKLDVRSVLHD